MNCDVEAQLNEPIPFQISLVLVFQHINSSSKTNMMLEYLEIVSQELTSGNYASIKPCTYVSTCVFDAYKKMILLHIVLFKSLDERQHVSIILLKK